MFTGIVEELGSVVSAPSKLVVAAPKVAADSDPGASVAVNGVCLTVVDRDGDRLAFDVSEETLARSSLGEIRAGEPVNLERPVTLLARLGGHLVQGHVDGVGLVESVDPRGDGVEITVRAPQDLCRYVVEKGSIALDGVSLTVSSIEGPRFRMALVPFTLRATTLGRIEPGRRVNLEVDVIAKYIESFVRRSS